MDEFPAPESQPSLPQQRLVQRFHSLIEVVLVGLGGSILVPLLFSWIGIGQAQILGRALSLVGVLVTDASVTLLILAALMKLRGESFKSLGWNHASSVREIAIGILFLPVLFASTFVVDLAFKAWFPDSVTRDNPILSLVRDPGDLGLLLFSSLYVGGIKEELQRAFVLTRFRQDLGGVALGLVLWSLFFGMGHSIQGTDKAVAAGILGLLFGILYLWRGSLVGPIVAHSLYDVVTLLVYFYFLADVVQP